MKNNFRYLAMLLALAMPFGFYACSSDSDSGSSSSSADASYSGPGSFWTANLLEDLTFTITYAETSSSAVALTITGTFERLSTGFLKLTVGESVGDDGPSAGEQAVALEIPGYGLILKPLGGSEIIPMMTVGSCPTEDFTANWMNAQDSSDRDATDPDREWFGTFAYDASTGMAEIPSDYNLVDFTAPGDSNQQTLDASDCTDGFLRILEGSDPVANMWLTPNGAIVQTLNDEQEGNDSILAMLAQEISLADLEGDYAGLVLQGSADEDEAIFPVAATLDASGDGTGAQLSNVETGATSDGDVSISLGTANSPSNGWITGTLGDDSDPGNLACMANTNVGDNGDTVIFCIGQDPGDKTQNFNILMKKN